MLKKILFIHGSTVKHTYSFFRKADPDWGFAEILQIINSQNLAKVEVFGWGPLAKQIKWWQVINPFYFVGVYFEEKTWVKSNLETENLHKKILYFEPEIIVCHSMGGFLLEKYLQQKKDLPNSVKQVITLMSDGEVSFILPKIIQTKVQNQNLKWLNYHCFWDLTLICSVIINQKFPAGVFGYKSKYITNKFYFLTKTFPDFHTSLIKKSKKLPIWLREILK
jgi:hypothetical protein